MKLNHFLGGIFLVAGTTIGVGMLGAPVLTGLSGFMPSLALFVVCWSVMLVSAFFFLDVNLAVRGEPNMISMAGKTLGLWGKVVAWIVYLLLLYSLTAAYISASAPLFIEAIAKVTGYTLPTLAGPFLLPLIFGSFVYLGTLGVDMINRILMIGLLISYFLLIGSSPQHVNTALLKYQNWNMVLMAAPVILTAFGYHIIIPSLTTYMNHDRKHLVYTIVVGSVLSLAAYVFWQLLTLGVVPLDEIVALNKSGGSITTSLAKLVGNPWMAKFAQFFSFFAITTSFLGVSLSLSDFLTDGFKIKKSWEGRLLAWLLTFVPPLVFVYSYPRGFLLALQYAGTCVAVLLIFLPAAMAWTLKKPKFYTSLFGKLLILIAILFAIGIIALDISKYVQT